MRHDMNIKSSPLSCDIKRFSVVEKKQEDPIDQLLHDLAPLPGDVTNYRAPATCHRNPSATQNIPEHVEKIRINLQLERF